MVLDTPGPVMVDGKVICQSIHLNMHPQRHQLRCKIEFEKPIDLAVNQYSTPKINGTGIAIEFNGVEMETETAFEAKVGFSLLTRKWKLSGKIGSRSFSRECSHMPELVCLLKEMVLPVYDEPRRRRTVGAATIDGIVVKVNVRNR